MDDNWFDHHWDKKSPNGMNVTENKLNKAFNRIGLYPEPQYKISRMTVDFAFIDEKVVIEVDGPHHYRQDQIKKDDNRYWVLMNLGWKVKTYDAELVYYDPDKVAKEIKDKIFGSKIDLTSKEINNQDSILEDNQVEVIENKDAIGVIGFILSVYGLILIFIQSVFYLSIFSLIPKSIFSIGSIIFLVAGVLCGIQIKRHSNGLAIAGLIIAIIGLILRIL